MSPSQITRVCLLCRGYCEQAGCGDFVDDEVGDDACLECGEKCGNFVVTCYCAYSAWEGCELVGCGAGCSAVDGDIGVGSVCSEEDGADIADDAFGVEDCDVFGFEVAGGVDVGGAPLWWLLRRTRRYRFGLGRQGHGVRSVPATSRLLFLRSRRMRGRGSTRSGRQTRRRRRPGGLLRRRLLMCGCWLPR